MIFKSVLSLLFGMTGLLVSPSTNVDELILTRSAGQISVDTVKTFLPIVVIETNGIDIPDEPKILANLGIIHRQPGLLNRSTDPRNVYDGVIGIETRGSTAQLFFPKKSFAIETRDQSGEDLDVEILDMPEEEDWILYGPYSDKTMIRNMLAFHLSRTAGRYASRTQPVEVILNGSYEGVYIWMEKIKRDKNRVNIAKLEEDDNAGDALTGGYLIKIDKLTGAKTRGWESQYPPFPGSRAEIFYQFEYPDEDRITFDQKSYIRGFVNDFENATASNTWSDPLQGYPAFLDLDATIDYFLVNELAKNVDAYRLSTFLHKDRDSRGGGKMAPGPVWDFNIAFGNTDYYGGYEIEGWVFDEPYFFGEASQRPFWWSKIWDDPPFQDQLKARWNFLRAGPWHSDSLTQYIETWEAVLQDPAERNFTRWPILGEYIWPNPVVGSSYADEVSYLKSWLEGRIEWMDSQLNQIGTYAQSSLPQEETLDLIAYPNPFSTSLRVSISNASTGRVSVRTYDILGRLVNEIYNGVLHSGSQSEWVIETGNLAAGVYFIELSGESFRKTLPVLHIK